MEIVAQTDCNPLKGNESEGLRRYFDQSPFGICLAGNDDRVLQVNATFRRMFGSTERELLAEAWWERIHVDDRETVLRKAARVRQRHGGSEEAEVFYLDHQGKEVCCRVVLSTARSDSGEVFYSVFQVEDISHRERTEARNRDQDRFRIMADRCPAIMWLGGTEGQNLFINRAYRDFCGTTFDKLESRHWQKLLHQEDAAAYIAKCVRSVEEQGPLHGEVRLLRADGEWRWIASHSEARFSPAGEFLGHVGFGVDVTEHKEAEQALRVSEEKFRQLAQNLREVLWLAAPDGSEISR